MAVGDWIQLDPIIRGDYEVIDFVHELDGAPENISDKTIVFTAKEKASDELPVFQKTLGAGITITDGAAGAGFIEILGEDTAGITQSRTLYCDIEVTDGLDRSTTTLYKLPVKTDVNNA